MILFDNQIVAAIAIGDVVIDPFDTNRLGPNSYDLRLGSELLTYRGPGVYESIQTWDPIDMRDPARSEMNLIAIPEEGRVLFPGTLYLGHTIEVVGTRRKYVPHIEGRSSIGRLGMAIHVTAGFGDVGFCGRWTLEITVVHPLRVYADERVAQVYFIEGRGEPNQIYDREYSGRSGPVPSRGSG